MQNDAKIEGYLRSEYLIEVVRDKDGSYITRIPDLPGCIAEGRTSAEAIKNIGEAKKEWLELALEEEAEIPVPSEELEYSGHILLRMAKSLHATLARMARRENISLNQFINQLLCVNLGLRLVEKFDEKLEKGLREAEVRMLPHYFCYFPESRKKTKELLGEELEPIPVSDAS